MEEIWKEVEGFEGLYKVSNKGRVLSMPKCNSRSPILKKMFPDKDGYLKSSFSKNGKCVNFILHRIVAKLFVNNPDDKPEVNHIDGNKLNNDASNLEWVTRSENQKHAYEKGLQVSPKAMYGRTGKNSPFSKIVHQYDLDDNHINTFYGTSEASRETGVHQATISLCCRNRLKTAGKFKWEYEKI